MYVNKILKTGVKQEKIHPQKPFVSADGGPPVALQSLQCEYQRLLSLPVFLLLARCPVKSNSLLLPPLTSFSRAIKVYLKQSAHFTYGLWVCPTAICYIC